MTGSVPVLVGIRENGSIENVAPVIPAQRLSVNELQRRSRTYVTPAKAGVQA